MLPVTNRYVHINVAENILLTFRIFSAKAIMEYYKRKAESQIKRNYEDNN